MRKVNKYPLPVMILLLILGCGRSSAQDGLQVGISTGVQNTLLWAKGRSEIDVRNAFRPLGSADIEYRLTPGLGIQSGIGYALYSQNTGKFRNNFNYLTVPLYLKLGGFRNNNRKFALGLFGGPNFKFLVSANTIYQDEKNDISEYTTGFHPDYTFGAGLKYKLSDNLILESHLTGTLKGGSFNKISFDGFYLRNINYGTVVGFKYNLKIKETGEPAFHEK